MSSALLYRAGRASRASSFYALARSSTIPSIISSHFGGMTQQQWRSMSTQQREKLFDKILIANRGEIACRVMRTCKKLGIKTVAIYSEADKDSVHVGFADEAYCVGPAASSQSYLNIDNIVNVIKKTGTQAVHPGYGFLSENKEFQEALEKIGVKFIGPGHNAITLMGDKISSKKIARDAKVNIIPGHMQHIDTEEECVEIARKIGYPVMVKASGGGGGKGMRVAYNDEECRSGYRLSRAEAKAAFGRDTMFVEKYIEEPRHIEIQLLADGHGNAIYLNERECSVQRRNQKIIEEAPSIFLDEKTRAAMGNQAVTLAKAVGYESAGTCEFLVDKHRNFYFLEMNTRLQVEHPVTEQITGVDIVEQMIRIATGEPLRYKQEDIKINGWSFESRVYAEDPLRNFLPSIGTLKRYVEPKGPHIRIDSGIREGSEISIHYDPMISKLITYGATRNEALQYMREALDSYVIRGLTHNINFLRSLCDHPRFIEGRLSTAFIPEEYPQGYKGATLTNKQQDALLASAANVYLVGLRNQVSLTGKQRSFNPSAYVDHRLHELVITLLDKHYRIRLVTKDALNSCKVSFDITPLEGDNKTPTTVDIETSYQRGDWVFVSTVNGTQYVFQVMSVSDSSPILAIQYAGTSFKMEVRSPREYELMKFMPVKEVVDTSKLVVSPMPGAVFAIKVKAGDTVFAGQEVCIVEAMKMQNALRAVNNGVVKKIHVKQGQTVSADQVLLELE